MWMCSVLIEYVDVERVSIAWGESLVFLGFFQKLLMLSVCYHSRRLNLGAAGGRPVLFGGLDEQVCCGICSMKVDLWPPELIECCMKMEMIGTSKGLGCWCVCDVM